MTNDHSAEHIARYGKAVWTHAVTLAGRHRARAAKRYGLSEHWSAALWLDLCARTGFRCSACGAQARLTPHHRTSMTFGGANTSDNIAALCQECHQPLFDLEASEVSERERLRLLAEEAAFWFEREQSLVLDFARGDAVCADRFGVPRSLPGVVVRVLPPERGDPVRFHGCLRPHTCGWREARALVYWPMNGRCVYTPSRAVEAVALSHLDRVDMGQRLHRERETLSLWRVGERVRTSWGPRAAHGDIIALDPPDGGGPWDLPEDALAAEIAARWRPWSDALARVRWRSKNGRVSYKTMRLGGLGRADERP